MGAVGQPLEIPATQGLERLTGLELEIDVKAHEPVEPVHLIRAVGGGPDARIDGTGPRQRLPARPAGGENQKRDRERQSSLHDGPPAPVRAVVAPGRRSGGRAPPTSSSERKSTTLNPSGFQRRTCGSVEGMAYV